MTIDKQYLSPSELEVVRNMEAAEAAGDDVYGDRDPAEAAALSAAADVIAADDAGTTTATADDADTTNQAEATDAAAQAAAEAAAQATDRAASADAGADGAPVVEDAAAAPSPAPADPLAILFRKTEDLNAVEQRIVALETKKGELLAEYDDGTITRDDFLAQSNRVDRAIRDADRDLTIYRFKTQAEEQSEVNVLRTLANEVRDVIDYSANGMGAQFDTVLSGVRANPLHASRTYEWQAREAHRVMLALSGKLPAAPKAAAPVARDKAPPPKTLANLPSAAIPNTGTDLKAALSGSSGAVAMQQWERLTKAQQAAILGE